MCGVIGIIGEREEENPSWAAHEAYNGLLTLQHRGQDAAGCLSFDPVANRFSGEKSLGLISNVFSLEKLNRLKGPMAIAHTRYATVGGDGSNDLQPLVTGFPMGVGMAHNGNLVNYHNLVDELSKEKNIQFLTSNDLEVMLHLWSDSLMNKGRNFNFEDGACAAEKIVNKTVGAYALLGLVAGKGMFALRDPQGIRPLVLGKKTRLENNKEKVSYCLCSESVALTFLGYEYVRDIKPGEFIFISLDGQIRSRVFKNDNAKTAHCMFEWIYFSGAESTLESKSVYGSRLNLGRVLANKIKDLIESKEINPDIVCPVPDTSRTAAISLAETLSLPYREGLIKNRYIQRSFILNTQEKREKAVELKLAPVRSEIEGKNILLVDDSIVRGTTSKKIIELLKRFGAKEITLAITCPPIRYGCYYGIDFPKSSDLIANDKSISQIASWVGANQVIYLSEEDVKKAIGISDLCMACISGKYPTSLEGGEIFIKKREELRGN